MKKKKVLKFSKETVTRLDNNSQKSINGGLAWTGGCTDGCGTTKTWLNCTEATCTADCETRINCSPTSGVDKTTCTFVAGMDQSF